MVILLDVRWPCKSILMDGCLLLLFSIVWVLAGVKSSAMLVVLRTLLYAAAFIVPSSVFVFKAKGQRKRRKPGKTAQTTAAGAMHLEQPEAHNQRAEDLQLEELHRPSARLTVSCCSPAAADAAAADAATAAGSPLASLVSLQDWGTHAVVLDCTAPYLTCSDSGSSSSSSSVCSPAGVSSSAALDAPVSFPASRQPLTTGLGGSLDSAAWHTCLQPPSSCQQNAATSLGRSLDSAAWRTLLHPSGCQRPSMSSDDDAAAAGLSDGDVAEQLLQDGLAMPSLSVCTSSQQLSAFQRSSCWRFAGGSASGSTGGGCDALPLPSPAGSPLARRVTDERDENGLPTSPALLGLLQQRAAADASAAGSWQEDGEQQEQQHVPWTHVQLRAVPQKLSDGHSSADEAASAGTSPPWLPLIIRRTSCDARSNSSDSSGPRSQLRHSKPTAAASGKAATAAAAAAAVAVAEAAAHKNRVTQLAALHSAAAAAAAAGCARRDQRLLFSCKTYKFASN
ncbi:hypothetical protein COO60DRAFT_1113876 [Scenedesmus sp. NREL 46B-D3]|nr:hypothetical protein COO60DRAFT_1113876 [Scenedesmus sp. NREL 46B-D3]